ncbi:hypothetical protein VTK73DRAFT_1326 [Phialemonium thermophilum]|uniref:Uncharacterized protein n=1 Tax=Phialemonium thermophilum TaxID=223376 RepID=A0ABR3XA07_9PEZI
MGEDGEPLRNPFVRFKQHVDAHVTAGLQGLLGLPALVTQNPTTTRDFCPRHDGSEHSPSQYGRSSDSYSTTSSSTLDYDGWLSEQREAAATEERLDRYYEGYGLPEHLKRWQLFVYQSPYSPLRLATLPRQPRPQGLPEGADPKMFSFVDAFEDLLAESAGRPMMDLQTRYEMNKLLARMWPRGEHPLSWFSRLESQDLTKVYFRYNPGHYFTPDRMSGWGELPRPEVTYEPEKSRAGRELDVTPVERTQSVVDRGSADRPGLFGELDRVFKSLAKVLEDEFSTFTSRKKPDEGTPDSDPRGREPGTEDDLYSLVQSAFHDAERSLSTFMKSFSQGRWGFETWNPEWTRLGSEKIDQAPAETEVHEDEWGKTVKSKKEFVDAFGNLHVKTEICRTDVHGNEVSKETHYSVRPVSPSRKAQVEAPGKESGETAQAEEEQDKKSGWFWK